MTGRIRLRSGDAVAEMSSQGAELLRWEVGGKPLLWTPDAAVWAETAPILFPIVGWTRGGQVRVAGQSYPLGLHGFARHAPFRVARLGEDFVRLVLDATPRTLGLYPFDFRLCVDYRLEGAALSVGLSVVNRGTEPMPYACGLHPGFRWPLGDGSQNGHRIIFDAEEDPHVPEITSAGLFAKTRRSVPLDGRVLDLTPELFAREALCFLDARSRGLRFEAEDGTALRIEAKNFSHIALWAKPPAPFLAIEVWTGHGDPDGFDGDLSAKPSMRLLRPGESACHEARFTFARAGSGRDLGQGLAARRKSDTEGRNRAHLAEKRERAGLSEALSTQANTVETASDGILRPSAGKALIIDGKRVSELVLAETAEKVLSLAASGLRPGLAVVLAGNDPASAVYVRSKGKAAEACGFHSVQHTLPETVSEAEVLKLVEDLNADPLIHGILVQLPLPKGIDSTRVLAAISPAKDVDGFHPVNVGLLGVGEIDKALVPCTPAGSMVLIERAAKALNFEVSGCNAVVLGRSNIVGKPMAQLLLSQNATVTIAHSKTRDLAGVVGRADLLVTAVGRPQMVPGSWIKEGALVIDVGINRIPAEGLTPDGKPKTRLVGDVNFEEAIAYAGAITPVPGGVGPMTIAMLMANTLKAARRIAGLSAKA